MIILMPGCGVECRASFIDPAIGSFICHAFTVTVRQASRQSSAPLLRPLWFKTYNEYRKKRDSAFDAPFNSTIN
ncbi:MAG: hypothetical protein PHI31_16770 [Desulfuromonadaceae bacterium]|nr:hypothetical protein [Desulfuromonadaceae bacterium]